MSTNKKSSSSSSSSKPKPRKSKAQHNKDSDDENEQEVEMAEEDEEQEAVSLKDALELINLDSIAPVLTGTTNERLQQVMDVVMELVKSQRKMQTLSIAVCTDYLRVFVVCILVK